VLDGKIANVTDAITAIPIQKRLDGHFKGLQSADHLAHGYSPCSRNGHQYLMGIGGGDDARQVLTLSKYLHPMNALTNLTRVVIPKAHRLIVIDRPIVLHVAYDHFAGITRAIDQNTLLTLQVPEAMIDSARQTNPNQEEHQQNCVHDENRAGILGYP